MASSKRAKAKTLRAAKSTVERSLQRVSPASETPLKTDRADRGHRGRKLGRRHTYTDALGRAICTMLASGMSLNQICRRPGMPSDRTVRTWGADEGHPFSPQYARARELGYHRMIDEILDASDDSSNDWVDRELRGGKTTRLVDPEAVARSRLRIDTRKWVLSKVLPKVYGDKVSATVQPGEGFLDVWRALTSSYAAEAS